LHDRGENLARQAPGYQIGARLWLLGANDILRAHDALEAIVPAVPLPCGVHAPADGTCTHLLAPAAQQLRSIPKGHQPAGLALAHRAGAQVDFFGGKRR